MPIGAILVVLNRAFKSDFVMIIKINSLHFNLCPQRCCKRENVPDHPVFNPFLLFSPSPIQIHLPALQVRELMRSVTC